MVGKTSKKGWRNIKLTEELSTLAELDHSKELSAKVDTLFTEDSVGGSKGVSKQIGKTVQLQNSKGKAAVSNSEAILLQRKLVRAGKPVARPHPKPKQVLSDIWGETPDLQKLKLLPSTVLRRESLAPAVVPAISALSVNPSEDNFNQMLLAEAKKEFDSAKPSKPKIQFVAADQNTEETVAPVEEPAEVPSSDRKTKAQKLKEKRHKQMLREHERRRMEKEARKALQNKVALKEAETLHAQQRQQRLKTAVRRVIEEATGNVSILHGAGGRLALSKDQFPTEIAASLRRIVPVGNPVLERRASLLKRRMIEQVPEINAEYKEKVRFAKHNAGKARKLLDSDTKERCVLLG